MSKMSAIKSYCFDCAGGTSKEVTLCHLIDCPLWQYRLGSLIRSKTYKDRMATAKKNYPDEFEEIAKLSVTYEDYLAPCTTTMIPRPRKAIKIGKTEAR